MTGTFPSKKPARTMEVRNNGLWAYGARSSMKSREDADLMGRNDSSQAYVTRNFHETKGGENGGTGNYRRP